MRFLILMVSPQSIEKSPMSSHTEDHAIWTQKGATLSDNTARKEFDLTEAEIIAAIQSGKLQYRHNTLYGNPCLKLLRTEVEALVAEKYGSDHLKNKQLKAELSKVTTEIRSLKRKLTQLENRKAELLQDLES
jgi:histidine ammonia-lyase